VELLYMKRFIFVNNENNAEFYFANYDERKIRYVQEIIDNFFGKGRVKTKTAEFLKNSCNEVRLEIISIQMVSKNTEKKVFEYTYQEFVPHKISKMCDSILESENNIEFSKIISELLFFISDCVNETEKNLAKLLLSFITFKKCNINYILNNEECDLCDKSVFEKILNVIKNVF